MGILMELRQSRAPLVSRSVMRFSLAQTLLFVAHLAALQLQQLQQEFEQLPRPNLAYPAYYTMPFHAYDEGNLNWQVRFRHKVPPVQGFVCMGRAVRFGGTCLGLATV